MTNIALILLNSRKHLTQRKCGCMINDDNNPFTMASIKERVLVVDKPYKLLPHMWKKGPHYDQETDTWLMTRESFNADSIKFFEYKKYAECSVRLYEKKAKPHPLDEWCIGNNPSKLFSMEELLLQLYKCVHKTWSRLSRVFWDEPEADDKRNTTWLENECASFMLKERLCYTTKRTRIVGMCAIVQAYCAWRSSGGRQPFKNARRSFGYTYMAGWGSLWLYDCCQRNKQKWNIPGDKIKMAAGGAFVASTATIAYIIPPDYTSAKIYEPGLRVKNSCLKNIINTGLEKLQAKYPLLKCIPIFRPTNGPIKPLMTIGILSRPTRGLAGAVVGSLCLLATEDLYLMLDISGSRRERSDIS